MTKLCKDQKDGLVAKIAALFKDVSADEVDEVVAQAKTKLVTESKQAKRGALEKLFDAQIATLKDRGCPEQIVELLQQKRGEVVSKASEMTVGEGNIPFLPVVPRTYLTIYSQMPMVRNDSKVGYTYLKPTAITDVVETPSDPYYIYDVEDGQAMCGKAPQDAEKLIKRDKRFGLTDVEVIALGVHTDVLLRHYVDAVGSRYQSAQVPYLYLFDGEQPRLHWDYLAFAGSRWGAASCGSR